MVFETDQPDCGEGKGGEEKGEQVVLSITVSKQTSCCSSVQKIVCEFHVIGAECFNVARIVTCHLTGSS